MMIYVDADACPVKEEIYRVARRYALPVKVVANSYLLTPRETLIERVVVEAGPDAADDWIAEREVIGPTGHRLTADNIGTALAARSIGEHLRSMGEVTRGPTAFEAADRSRFLSALDEAVHRARRAGAGS
jgi:uncharacterized protein YaiI (UPF0178 family)